MKNSFVSRWFWRASAGALVLGAWALAGAAQAQDFYDDFTDPGFTQSAWTAVDPRSVVFQQPTGSWGVGNGWYEVFAVPTPTDLIPTVGGARMGSIINNFIGADFYGMFTLEGFDPVQGQFMGLGARLTTVDLGMTSGYVFGYDNFYHAAFISRIEGERSVQEIARAPLTLSPDRVYRFFVGGTGPDLNMSVFDALLPDPLAVLDGTDPTYSSGQFALLAADNSFLPGASVFARFGQVGLAIVPEPWAAGLAAGLGLAAFAGARCYRSRKG